LIRLRIELDIYFQDQELLYDMAGGGTPIGPTDPPLSQAWGYGIVLGIGFLFALGMVCKPFVVN
jgi:hypothetical protein